MLFPNFPKGRPTVLVLYTLARFSPLLGARDETREKVFRFLGECVNRQLPAMMEPTNGVATLFEVMDFGIPSEKN